MKKVFYNSKFDVIGNKKNKWIIWNNICIGHWYNKYYYSDFVVIVLTENWDILDSVDNIKKLLNCMIFRDKIFNLAQFKFVMELYPNNDVLDSIDSVIWSNVCLV